MRTAVAIATLLAFEGARAAAHAEDALRIALFKTASEDADLQSLAAAIDPVLLSELGNVPNLQVAARPALDLPSMQLAVDCVGETAECLARAAKEAQSDGLVAPLVRRIGAEVVVTVLLHDARKQTTITAATRRYSGQHVEDQVLDAIPGMVRELFGLQSAPIDQPAASQATAPSEAPELSSETSPPVAVAKPLPILPIVVGAVGVAMIAAGVGFGLSAKSAEDDYAKLRIPKDDVAAAGRAQDKIDSAATQAMLSNLGIGVGAAAVAAGIVLFVLQSQSGGDHHDTAQAASGMRLASGLAQLTLSGTWN